MSLTHKQPLLLGRILAFLLRLQRLQDLRVLGVLVSMLWSRRTMLVVLEVLFLEKLVRIRVPVATTLAPGPLGSPGTTRLAGATGTTRPRGSGGTVELLIVSMLWP